jgi:hypothetical protein
MVCPEFGCTEGQCMTEFPQCPVEPVEEYDPCAEKEPGAECQLCPPESVDCIETDEIKTCQEGQCLPAVEIAVQ